MKRCINCGHAVGQGDRHGKRWCPPRQTNRRWALRRRARRRSQKLDELPKRGQAVAGTGVPKGE